MNAPFTYSSPTLSVEALKHSIAYKLMFTIGKDPVVANKHEWLNATLFAVRDRLVERWLRSNRAQLSQETRQVYYLSMEFLIGRTLSNAMLSLGIYEDVQGADEGIRIYRDDSQESSIYFCNSFSPYYAGDENDLETVEVNEELTALHGIETSGEWISESYVFKGDFTGQGFYNITISMSQKDYKKYKKIISQMVASCQIREWEPENATVSESIENVEKYSK